MWIDQRGSEVLTRNECLRLLAVGAGGVGRVGLVDTADQVVIEPVNYRMLDQDVLVQVGAGSMLDAAINEGIVSFEIDQLSTAAGQAWSVLVHGLATVLHDSTHEGSARPSGGAPLVPEPGHSLVRIRTEVLSGRRFPLRAGPEPGSAEPAPAGTGPGTGRIALGDLSLRRPARVSRDATIRVLAGAMEDEAVSAVLVGEHPGWLVTERDLTGALAAGLDPDATATQVATKTPICAPASTTVSEAAAILADHGVRHLPVVTAGGEPIGLLSMLDVIRLVLDDGVPRAANDVGPR
jgi:CBS domain-containing protein